MTKATTQSAAGLLAAIVIATAQDKTSGTGTGTATGTTAQMQAKYSQQAASYKLTATFEIPNTIQHLHTSKLTVTNLMNMAPLAAYSLLGVSNRAYAPPRC